MSVLGETAMFYLAAAVSDFFIPEKKMVEHKIQSSGGGLSLELDQVPKIIRPLVQEWANKGFILETDESLLIPKALMALSRYGHQIVIGNVLSTRKRVVTFISSPQSDMSFSEYDQTSKEIKISEEQEKDGEEIEKFIIEELIIRHSRWIEMTKK
ncbi:hypothetical protein HK096_010564 [Nowakowskiella sp. JEL0078]|nr:hypothetical protein HK096_010564 [Nowakowskiella sp. JEL0078]